MPLFHKLKVLLGAALILVTAILAHVHPAVAANDDDELIYLDPSGVIRVFDPAEAEDSPLVEWASPTSGWISIALGDVNGDSDMEIVAVGTRSSVSYLAVFDPVAAPTESNREQVINGIPWDLLYELQLAGRPRLVATGEFDLSSPGAEIIYSYELPPEARISEDDYYRFVVLHGQSEGRSWSEQTTFDTGNEWTWITTGDLDNAGIDEVALADSVNGTFAAFRVGDGFERIFRRSSSERPWFGSAIGPYELAMPNELIAVREADYPLASLWAFRFGLEEWTDVYAEVFIPSPRFVFLVDITGNGDQEIVMMRSVPQELGNRPRIFIRDNGNDNFVFREATLDVDNGYQSGTGADVNGDGRDAIVIVRPDRLRIYTDPEDSAAAQDFPLAIDPDNIWSGNLDAQGLPGKPVLVVEPEQISERLTVGETSDPIVIAMHNAGSEEGIAYIVSTDGSASWVTIDGNASGETPSNVVITFNAIGLSPGTYERELVIESTEAGLLQEVERVSLSLIVDSGVTVLPAKLTEVSHSCANEEELISRPLAVEGTDGIRFSVAIDDSADWLSVLPLEGTVPTILTATFDPSESDQAVAAAEIMITTDDDTLTEQEAVVSVRLLCATHQLALPIIAP